MTTSEKILFLGQDFKIVRKSKRRNLSIKLKVDSFQILTNQTLPQKQIFEFLLSKKNWLEQNFQILELEKKKTINPEFQEGSLFPYFGEMKYLTFTKTKLKKIKFAVEDGFLVCQRPVGRLDIKSSEFKKVLIQYYKDQAQSYLISRCLHLASELNFQPAQVKIQTAKTRWGSCNSKKNINLNWKLIAFPKVLIDYVIIHELCHLRHMNHSALFWSLVESLCPYYKESEQELKAQMGLTAFLSSEAN